MVGASMELYEIKKTTGQPNAKVRIETLDVRERPFTHSSQEESQSCFAPDPSRCLQPSPYRLYQPSKVFCHPYRTLGCGSYPCVAEFSTLCQCGPFRCGPTNLARHLHHPLLLRKVVGRSGRGPRPDRQRLRAPRGG